MIRIMVRLMVRVRLMSVVTVIRIMRMFMLMRVMFIVTAAVFQAGVAGTQAGFGINQELA